MLGIFTPRRLRLTAIVTAYIGLSFLSGYASFWLKYDGVIPPVFLAEMVQALPIIIGVRLITFIPFHLYRGLWRYTSLWDIRNIILAVGSSSLIIGGIFAWQGVLGNRYPVSIGIMDAIFLSSFLCAVRLGRRMFYERSAASPAKRILIIGAGDAGEMIIRDMKNNPYYNYSPAGIVDDDPLKMGTTIHGVKVLGRQRDLVRIFQTLKPQEVLIAIPSAEPVQIRQLVAALEPFKVPIKTLPNLRDVLDGRVTLSQIRNLSMEDLLSREKLQMDDASVRQYVRGKKILVTGAGGSIGSELCRQLMGYEPEQLIIVDQYENNLFYLQNELTQKSTLPVIAAIANVADRHRIQEVFSHYHPQIIFHAAAHKHVPLMEGSPFEAIKNNIFGTWNVVSAAMENKVESFVLISTDKAVKPSSFMGATKAVAELLVRALAAGESATRLVAVRFGNVLGSQGSVVPVFMKQIEQGGPVTITHPDMKRYFMLIPEAAQLVLQASSMGKSGDLFILEMGEQIKINEMARTLIQLAGYIPDKEIKIEVTGIRPGEKLYEELYDPDREIPSKSENPHIHLLRARDEVSKSMMLQWLSDMGGLLASPDRSIADAAGKIQEILPQFKPDISVARQVLEKKFSS